MNNFLRKLAQAHARHEGYFVGSVSYRNNNPGNIRGKGGAFIHYPTLGIGYAALEGDISAKIENRSKSMDRYYIACGLSYSDAVFIDYINVYAPTADNNNPLAYVIHLCQQLEEFNVKPDTPLSILAQLIRGEIDRVRDPMPPVIAPEARIRGLERRQKKEKDPETRASIDRLLKRLLARAGRQS